MPENSWKLLITYNQFCFSFLYADVNVRDERRFGAGGPTSGQ